MAARRKIGDVERAVRRDLRAFPKAVSGSAVAQAMLTLAAQADILTWAAEADGEPVEARDLGQLLRELRLCSAALREMAPSGAEGDKIDELRKRREERLLREHGS